MKIAIVGDLHGHINLMYQRLLGLDINMIIQLGDFLPVRNEGDLKYVPVPTKYKKVGDFPEYFSGKRRAPIPTLFLSGNHEPFNFINKGFKTVAENIACLGACGVRNLLSLSRLAGLTGPIPFESDLTFAWLSGIYSERYFDTPVLEVVTEENKKQASYIRAESFYELSTQLGKRRVDILLMHQPTASFENYLIQNNGLKEKDVNFCMGDVLLEQYQSIKTVFVGHTHVFAETTINNTKHIALADIQSAQTNYVILDI